MLMGHCTAPVSVSDSCSLEEEPEKAALYNFINQEKWRSGNPCNLLCSNADKV